MVARETDKDCFVRRAAVDPIFNIDAVGVTFAYFAVGFAQSSNHLFAIHTDGGMTIGDGLAYFRRDGIDILDRSGTSVGKIKKRLKNFLEFGGSQVRDTFRKGDEDGSTRTGLETRGSFLGGGCGLGLRG